MKRDSIANTFVVAGGLCIVCSLLVSGAAVMLRPLQEGNVEADKKRNILIAAGLMEPEKVAGLSKDELDKFFKERIDDLVVDLETGEIVTDDPEKANAFDQNKAAKTEGEHKPLDNKEDIAGIKRRENQSHVYRYKDENGKVLGYVFPVRGYGLWSTLYGYLAVQADLETIQGLTFYQHGETPGLGGEVDNPKWKATWNGKKIYGDADDEGVRPVEIQVVRGIASGEYEVDGLSGATITSTGVSNLLKYWLGPDGFRPFIDQIQEGSSSSQANATIQGGGSNG